MNSQSYVSPFEDLDMNDVAIVGGKNASLGEMTRHLGELGVRIPEGFATTAQAYRDFVKENDLETRIGDHIDRLQAGKQRLADTGSAIRELFLKAGDNFKEKILPAKAAKVAVEAGVSYGWGDIVGNKGTVLGIDRFGESGPAAKVAEHLGLTSENLQKMIEKALANT